ncbi:MAG: transcriptional regulator NrdR [Gammaproteobacteria bacterium]|jgi:transcriptional repressor NrdR
MRCPFCGYQETKVTDSRLVGEGDQIRRRRECLKCEERYTTFESAELTMPRIVKRDASREAFDDEKLRDGLQKALQKRPVSSEEIEAAIHRLKRKLRASGEREILSQTLGEWVMVELRQLDDVAYVRFASVYRQFQDINAFEEEIEMLRKQPEDHV